MRNQSLQTPLLECESRDSMAQFLVWMPILFVGSIFAIPLFRYGGVVVILGPALATAILVSGLRVSIVVTQDQVRIVRKWFFIPYRSYQAPEIEDVWFGGDWGLDEGADGIVVKIGGKEVNVGTSKNMHSLHASLWPFSAEYRRVHAEPSSRISLSSPPIDGGESHNGS